MVTAAALALVLFGQPTEVMVMSGGLSRGAFQAGALYAEGLRLRVSGENTIRMAGASVGALNALLGAVDFCRADYPAPERSELWKLWSQVAWDDMLVSRSEQGDGLSGFFTFQRIKAVEGLLVSMGEPTFRVGCRAELAVSLMGTKLEKVHPDLEEKTHRRLATLTLSVLPDGRLCIKELILPRNGGSYGGPPQVHIGPGCVAHRKVMDLIARASSPPIMRGLEIPEGAAEALFDGAIFDRLPVAGALLLLTDSLDVAPAAPVKLTVIDMGADSITLPATPRDPSLAYEAGLEFANGSGFYRGLVGELADVANNLEIQTWHRHGAGGQVTQVVRHRRWPMFGDLLSGFAAFLDERFRRFDFQRGLVATLLTEDAKNALWWNDRASSERDFDRELLSAARLFAIYDLCGRSPCPQADRFDVPNPPPINAMLMALLRTHATPERLRQDGDVHAMTEIGIALREAGKLESPKSPLWTFDVWWHQQIRAAFARAKFISDHIEAKKVEAKEDQAKGKEAEVERGAVSYVAGLFLGHYNLGPRPGVSFLTPGFSEGRWWWQIAGVVVPDSWSTAPIGNGNHIRWDWVTVAEPWDHGRWVKLTLGGSVYWSRRSNEPIHGDHDLVMLSPRLSLSFLHGLPFFEYAAPEIGLRAGPTFVACGDPQEVANRAERIYFEGFLKLANGWMEVAVGNAGWGATSPTDGVYVTVGLARISDLFGWVVGIATESPNPNPSPKPKPP